MQPSHSDVAADGSASDNKIDVVTYTPSAPDKKQKFNFSPLRIALLLLFGILLFALWFVFTARSVWVQVTPTPDQMSLDGGRLRIAWKDHYLMRPGELQLSAEKEGYYPLSQEISVGSEAIQNHEFELQKLPGKLRFVFNDEVEAATIFVGDQYQLDDINGELEVPPGEYDIRIESVWYKTYHADVDVVGLGQLQSVNVNLKPDWADVSIETRPVPAQILVGEKVLGDTPGTFRIMAGEHAMSLRAPGYKHYFKTLNLAAEEQLSLSDIVLAKADGTVSVTTAPVSAAIAVNGKYKGMSPQKFRLPPGRTYTVSASKVGYGKVSEQIKVVSDRDVSLQWMMEPLVGMITISGAPAEARVWLDGQQVGQAGAAIELPARDLQLEIRAEGFAAVGVTVLPKPGLPQTVTVKMLTLAQAREAELKRKSRIQTADGQTLLLMRPQPFTMGASRRVRGRRSNETLREVNLTRIFYIATREVSNRQFKAFDPSHKSGTAFKVSLEGDEHPVVNVSWNNAARYCNWLSQRDSLPNAYREQDGQMVAVVPATTGYRLPEEAEWAWAARKAGKRKNTLYPWGESSDPPANYGNFGDNSALGLISTVMKNYNDGYAATAPVGTFDADPAGLYDMAGNVSEWTDDPYRASELSPVPAGSKVYVLRGSSWQHAKIGELRPTYRDSSEIGRSDLGFRIGRYLE